MFWLEASALNEFAAIGSVGLIRVILLGKNRLDVMIPLIAGALNPDSLCLIYCWDSHDFLYTFLSDSLVESPGTSKGTGNTSAKAGSGRQM